jgi:nitrate reductase gamma subunit
MVQISAILNELLTTLALALAALNDVFEKHTKIVKVTFGALAVILCLLTGILLLQRSIEKNADVKHSEAETIQMFLRTASGASSIPAEDIFLPDEPDYLPNVILEREPHTWSEKDARGYWTNPLENEHINWRGAITDVVDDIMDKVP